MSELPAREPPVRPKFGSWIAVVVGWAAILFGALDYVAKRGTDDAIAVVTWVIGGNLFHDLFVVPVVMIVGVALAWLVREPWRTPIRAGVIASACVVVVAIPLLGGYGRKANNPTVLPLDYPSAVLTAVGIVWALAAGWLAVRLVRRHRRLDGARSNR